MATVETNSELGKRIVEDAKRYVLYSWSVQDAINPIAVAGAEGRYFWDYDGKRYLDFASQLVNVSLGYGHPKVVAAIKEQAESLRDDRPADGDRVAVAARPSCSPRSPRATSRVVLHQRRAPRRTRTRSSSPAGTPAPKIIARYRSYHGATAGRIAADRRPARWPVEPGIPGVVRMLDPYSYRCPFGHPDPCPVCTGAHRTSRRS